MEGRNCLALEQSGVIRPKSIPTGRADFLKIFLFLLSQLAANGVRKKFGFSDLMEFSGVCLTSGDNLNENWSM